MIHASHHDYFVGRPTTVAKVRARFTIPLTKRLARHRRPKICQLTPFISIDGF